MDHLQIKQIYFPLLILALVNGLFPTHGARDAAALQAEELSLFNRHTIELGPWDLVTALAWSPSGGTLAVAAGNKLLLYQSADWQLSTSVELGALTRGLAFSPDGARLASGSQDGYLRIWLHDQLLQEGASAPTITLPAHHKGVNSVSFSPDGSLIASGGNDAIARFWNPDNGELVGMAIGGTFAIPSLDFSPEGTVIGVVNGDLLRLRQVGSERITGTFQAEAPMFDIDFTPDGSLIAVSGVDGVVRLWNAKDAYQTGNPVFPEPIRLSAISEKTGSFRDLVWKTVFSPDGQWLATAGGDGKIRLWNPQSGEQIGFVSAHPIGAAGLAFHPEGKLLASGGLDGKVIIWEIKQ